MEFESIYQYLLSTDGVNQQQRSAAALDPASVSLDGRSYSDLLGFLLALSEQIRFYNLDNQSQGDWRPFFDRFLNPDGTLVSAADLDNLLKNRQDWSPHLALLMAFFKIYTYAQRDLNALGSRHLRYYYEDVLRLQRRLTQPDQVHVVFELAKSASAWLLPAGTLLDAGKNSAGLPLRYALDSEIVINRASIQSLKSVFVDERSDGKAIVFAADDATLVRDANSASWRPFGNRQLSLSPESRTMNPVSLGFAVASPGLLLAEGERSITLTLNLQLPSGTPPPADQELGYGLEISLTGEKGWIYPLLATAHLSADALTLTVQLPLAESPVVAYDAGLHGAGFETGWPVLRCLVKPESYFLEMLSEFSVNTVDLEVSANGLTQLILQNDDSLQPAGNPVLPFGSLPRIKNNFYIGSREVFSKTVQSLTLHLEWQDPPVNFNDYYKGYDNSWLGYDKFISDMYLLAGRSWNTRLLFDRTLFDGANTANIQKMSINATDFNARTLGSGFGRNPNLDDFNNFSSGLAQGFIKLVLTGPTPDAVNFEPSYAPFEAFGHKSFPTVYTRKAVELAKAGPGDPVPDLPNAPYTPTLKSVQLDYSAKERFTPGAPNGIDQFFLQDVFGAAETIANDTVRLLPDLPGQGALYIGLDKVDAPQTLSFLFQLEGGNTPGAELLEQADQQWSYLAGNRWKNIGNTDLLEDATGILQNPGLIRLNIGSDASAGSGLMPAGLQWLRLAVSQRADGTGSLQAIAVQAARATVIPDANGVLASQVLPAKTIARLVNKVAAVKTVTQDYPSFNGLAPEADTDFFRRVSERLRHRNRAVTGWDYERIVLEAFPDVFKVKCLPHTDEDNAVQPGHVKLVVVPDQRLRKTGDPLQPRANLAYLRSIGDFLQEKFLTRFIVTHIVNPAYETLLVDCKVAFMPGYDPGYYSAQLNEELRRFLSPWAYDEGQDIIFGGKIFKSELLAFVEGRVYVDYLVDFQLYHRFDGPPLPSGISCMTIGVDFIVGVTPVPTVASSADDSIPGATIGVDFVIGNPVEVAIATRPDAILVSNATHRIAALQDGNFVCSGVSTLGIGQMVIGLDFIPIS